MDKISPQDAGLENKPVFENLNELLLVIEFPMTGKELKAQYEFVFPINEKTTFYPRKNNKKGSSISNSILPGIF